MCVSCFLKWCLLLWILWILLYYKGKILCFFFLSFCMCLIFLYDGDDWYIKIQSIILTHVIYYRVLEMKYSFGSNVCLFPSCFLNIDKCIDSNLRYFSRIKTFHFSCILIRIEIFCQSLLKAFVFCINSNLRYFVKVCWKLLYFVLIRTWDILSKFVESFCILY